MNIEYKMRAKSAMADCSPSVYVVTLICGLIPFLADRWFDMVTFARQGLSFQTVEHALDYLGGLSLVQSVYLSAVSILLGILYSLLDYGYTLYCLKASRGHEPSYNDLAVGFYRPGRIICANIVMGVKIFLWSLLFVIPGIVAAISYSQTYRILADDPDVTATQAVRLSTEIMRGYKLQWFLLELSFIGWMLLAAITWNITAIYSTPYITITQSVFYDEISR